MVNVMKDESVTFQAVAWTRAEMKSLDIMGSIFGRSHTFAYKGRNVRIQIPKIPLGEDLRPVGRAERAAYLFSYRSEGASLVTSQYHLYEMDISIEIPDPITAPRVLLEQPPKQPHLAGEKLAAELDGLMDEYEDRLHDAFRYWQAVVRWITSSNELGCSQEIELAHLDSLQFTCLQRADDGKRFWLTGGYTSVSPGTTLTPELWDFIELALQRGDEQPLWFRYLDEAYRNGVARDLSGVVLSCAIACETITREVFWLSSGAVENEDARELLDRVPVRSILARWERLTGISKDRSALGAINDLFDLRNKLMHVGGRGRAVDESLVERTFEAARQFVFEADDWYYQKRGEPNPRPAAKRLRGNGLWAPVRKPRGSSTVKDATS